MCIRDRRDLVFVLLFFRIHAYVFTADIKQMYRKALLDESQRDFQRIDWRHDPKDPIKTYKPVSYTHLDVYKRQHHLNDKV